MSNRIVKLPSVESFGRLTPDKWLLLKTLEEAAEMVEAGKQYLKASDPTDPSGIGREFDDHANCLACFGVNVGGELGDDRDKAKWERDGVQGLPEYTFFIVMFRCTVCGLGFEGGCSRKPAPHQLQRNIAAWNRICNGGRRFTLTYESLGGRR